MATKIQTPLSGRLVLGHPFVSTNKDADGNVYADGRVQYFMHIAIPKNDPLWGGILATMMTEAKAGFPQFFPPAAASKFGGCNLPTFSWKITDGDSTEANTKGNSPSQREGYPGNWVLRFSSGFQPKVYVHANGAYTELTDPKCVKTGDYVVVSGSTSPNGSTQSPGLYLNIDGVLLVKEGKEIISSQSAESMFGAVLSNLPAQTATAGAPFQTPTPQPAAPVPVPTPAPDLLKGPQMAPGCPYTYASLVAAGWTDDQMRASGYLI
jgi:hypothetical protein